jgi:restriction endonuclease S subunit
VKKKLGDIAEIQFGPYAKGTEKGTVKYLLASHFDRQNMLSRFKQSLVEAEDFTAGSFLKRNDVILAGKGQRLFAWAYDESEGLCIPSSLFFVLEGNRNIIIGKYLAIFLNSEKVQFTLKTMAAGLTIPSISKNELKELKIFIPSLKEQKKIVEMAELMEEDISLAQKLLIKKKALKKTILNKMINPLN